MSAADAAPTRRVKVAVVGVGTMGSMALWALARDARRRGLEDQILGIEQFGVGHTHGAFSGESRLFRVATKEGGMFPRLALEARRRWLELGMVHGHKLLLPAGVLHLAPQDHADIVFTRSVIDAENLPHRYLDPRELRLKFPQFTVRDDDAGILDMLGGALRPEAAVLAAAGQARLHGAEIWDNTDTFAVEPRGDHVHIATSRGSVEAERVIVTAGPWTRRVVPELAAMLQVADYTLTWFAPRDVHAFLPDRFPGFMRDLDGQHSFGAPSIDGYSVKVSPHLELPLMEDVEDGTRTLSRGQLRWLGEQARAILPDLEPEPVRWSIHPDSVTRDHRPIIDTLHDGLVTVAAGMSGNGFKFSPIYGEMLAELALDGRSEWQHPEFTLEHHRAQLVGA